MPEAAPIRSLSTSTSPIETWHALLRPDVELTSTYWREITDQMKAARLTFGDRPLCPFLRPFFLTSADEARVRRVSETMARLGERVAQAALVDPALLRHVRLTGAEERLVRIDPGYATASTASRLDAFLLPDSLKFAEYNAESPAGPGYTQRLCELFDGLETMTRFKQRHAVTFHRTIPPLLAALLDSYREWGGHERSPTIAIVDWREVPTWTEFELLRDAFTEAGIPTVVADPRDLSYEGNVLRAADRAVDL